MSVRCGGGAMNDKQGYGAPEIPLFEAVLWVATKGETINPYDEVWPGCWVVTKVEFIGWNGAVDAILAAWRSNKLPVYGRRSTSGLTERIDGEAIVGVHWGSPYRARKNGQIYLSGDMCLEFWPRSTPENWEVDGFNDKLYAPGRQQGWTHLRVRRSDLELLNACEQSADSVSATKIDKPKAVVGPLMQRCLQHIGQYPTRKMSFGQLVQRVLFIAQKKQFPADDGAQILTRYDRLGGGVALKAAIRGAYKNK